ncbi:Wings apart protein [Caligus rogercresseyi]|uniref:Wings apart protein n=1 Tax=Caligus rogercresseyi TaxID=217165 RepID=A0A7T8JTP0_CALRO|nr:Wings apart protein [Caligus rogercresseyi]
MESNFRMHLRAHSCAPKFFTELRDSPGKASLALCAAAVLFVLSQDRLNMDLDKNSLELMLNLLDTESRGEEELMDEREFLRNKGKVRDLVAAMKARGMLRISPWIRSVQITSHGNPAFPHIKTGRGLV